MIRLKEFDYDIWTTDDNGARRCWARVRSTGEVTEISPEVMRFLRSEEKRLYRDISEAAENGGVLCLDDADGTEMTSWESDGGRVASDMLVRLEEEELRNSLTDLQLDVYMHCILDGESQTGYGRRHNMTEQTVNDAILKIRKKAAGYLL